MSGLGLCCHHRLFMVCVLTFEFRHSNAKRMWVVLGTDIVRYKYTSNNTAEQLAQALPIMCYGLICLHPLLGFQMVSIISPVFKPYQPSQRFNDYAAQVGVAMFQTSRLVAEGMWMWFHSFVCSCSVFLQDAVSNMVWNGGYWYSNSHSDVKCHWFPLFNYWGKPERAPHRRLCCGIFLYIIIILCKYIHIYIVRCAVNHFQLLFCEFLRHSLIQKLSPTNSARRHEQQECRELHPVIYELL